MRLVYRKRSKAYFKNPRSKDITSEGFKLNVGLEATFD